MLHELEVKDGDEGDRLEPSGGRTEGEGAEQRPILCEDKEGTYKVCTRWKGGALQKHASGDICEAPEEVCESNRSESEVEGGQGKVVNFEEAVNSVQGEEVNVEDAEVEAAVVEKVVLK